MAPSGPLVARSAPKTPPRTPQGHRKGAPRGPKIGEEQFAKAISYKKRENLKNEDLPTRKPHFSNVEGLKNQPKCVPNLVFSVLKIIVSTQCLK